MRMYHGLFHAAALGGTAFDRKGIPPFAALRDVLAQICRKKSPFQKPDAPTFFIASPLSGTVRVLNWIDDPIFSSEALGKGCAIEPTSGEVYAPFAGVVTQLAETGHAIGITGENGVELLIHVGMDTIELGGRYFEPQVKMGDAVEPGQLLLRFEMQAIAAAGYPLTTPVVVTNTDDYSDVHLLCGGKAAAGQELLAVVSAPQLHTGI